MRKLLPCLILLFIAPFLSVQSRAEEVVIESEGLDLIGNLETAPGKSLKSEGAVLLLHDTLSHNRSELMLALQDVLRNSGVNSLAITLSLGLDARRGMFDCSIEQDHRHEDAVDEIESWVSWLKEKGANSITLAGHGRGANQVALYAINKQDKAVRRIVLIAPLMQTYEKAEADYQSQFGQPLRDTLAKAEELVANDEGSTLLDNVGFLSCPQARVTASAFANYYNANPKFVTTNLLQTLTLPVLVLVPGLDPAAQEINTAMEGLKGRKSITSSTIQGADHDFHDAAADEAGKQIKDFVTQRVQG
jgi:pimeloyl-ACP methyl ester carboxylesterase